MQFNNVQCLLIYDLFIEKYLNIKNTNALLLQDCTNNGIINIDWDDAKKIANNTDKIILPEVFNSLPEKNKSDKIEVYKAKSIAKQFSMIKENYHNLGQYEDEDKAFVEYMRWRRKTLKHWWQKALDKLIEVLGKYATSPGRVAVWIAIIWFLFGIVYCVCLSFKGNFKDSFFYPPTVLAIKNSNISIPWPDWQCLNGFYFSLITLLTMTFDMQPASILVKVLAGIQGILGIFLFGYFSVAVVRKTLR